MNRLFIFTLWLVAMSAQAGHPRREPQLSSKDKVRHFQALGEALHDHHINQQQYEKAVAWLHAAPCDAVDRRLEAQRQAQLEAAIAGQQKRASVRVFESFRYHRWLALFTNASDGDPVYLFYAKDPTRGGRPLAAWGGAATIFETSEVAQWMIQHAPGIPNTLANCVGWHVTLSPAD